MPCESCHVQFTILRRKRTCNDCRCFYCTNCLTTTKKNLVLCQRCSIFAKRPLLRSDLQQLKPKDLIFYLQSKHISTAGCVEKEELVCLVLRHAEQNHSPSGQRSPENENNHSFDSLKQSCQNFFSNLSDNISDSFTSFEPKTNVKPTNGRQNYRRTSNSNNASTHIFEQPRVNTREIPTYASSQNASGTRSPQAATTSTQSSNVESINANVRNVESSPPLVTPVTSPPTSTATSPPTPQLMLQIQCTLNERSQNTEQHNSDKSDCECSDDEIIATFNERITIKTDNSAQCSLSRQTNETNTAALGPATTSSTTAITSATASISPGFSKQGSLSSKVDTCGVEISSQSSFEELGAIGGISDESKTTTDTNSGSNMDQWLVLDVQEIVVQPEEEEEKQQQPKTANETSTTEEAEQNVQSNIKPPSAPIRSKKVIRRRSDGYLVNKRHHSSDDESPIEGHAAQLSTLREQPEETRSNQQQRGCCQRCGKNKTNIRRHVERMRRHLESSMMSEEDIKYELQQFLSYLEQRTKSIECSDQESRAVSSLGEGSVEVNIGATNELSTPLVEFSPTPDEGLLDDNEGIHVYAAPAGYEASSSGIDSRFVNLDDFDDLKELENLTVKQLKEVLMLHRVDYKGCCEKQELLDRVQRLWKHLRSAPAVEKLATDELCKICMDAPIECVFLECGHMATCTNCGKVLNECPICRQYIVRVVRFFRA